MLASFRGSRASSLLQVTVLQFPGDPSAEPAHQAAGGLHPGIQPEALHEDFLQQAARQQRGQQRQGTAAIAVTQ